jgi:multicopper oxidase
MISLQLGLNDTWVGKRDGSDLIQLTSVSFCICSRPARLRPSRWPRLFAWMYFMTRRIEGLGKIRCPRKYPSPIGTSDPSARMVAVRCGESVTYNFHLPADHPSGLYWYRPHRHGSATVQVRGGMAGLIIVKGRSTRFQKSRRPATCPPHTVRLVTERRAGNGTEPVPTGI